MRTIGLIGGMSWESTVPYYQVINRVVQKKLGGLHSAKCLLYSVDFFEIEECQARGDWDKSAVILADAARRLEAAGADFIVICTNTMHKVADAIAEAIRIPILHIAEVTADRLTAEGIRTVGLLGTKYTMEQDFYKERLIARGMQVLVPGAPQRERLNAIIYDELCLGIIRQESKDYYLEALAALHAQGAEAVILGCTEIELLISQADSAVRLFDTTYIHAEEAALRALE